MAGSMKTQKGERSAIPGNVWAFLMFRQTFPDAAWVDPAHFVVGNRGVTESTFRGTRADSTRIEARMVDVFTFRDGKITVKNAFRKDRPLVKAGD